MKHLILLLLACTAAFAQKKFTVADSTTKEPIPYAGINLNNGYGLYSAEDGSVTLTDTSVTHITVSSIGYRDKKIAISALTDLVLLEPQPIELQEVVVSKKTTKKREATVKPMLHRDNGALFMSSIGLHYAFMVKSAKKEAYLTKITLPVFKAAFEAEGRPGTFDKISFRTFVKIEVLKNDNGLPGEKLLDFEQVTLVHNDKDEPLEITLAEELPVAETGMFVQVTILGRANADGSLNSELSYTTSTNPDGSIQKWPKYCQPNFPLVKIPKGTLTYIREPFSGNSGWRTIQEPHLRTMKEYPDFNIGFGYTTTTYE